jgi:hypothetical protein
MPKRGLHLYKRLALTTLSALIGLSGSAQADIHAAGPVYSGLTQAVISCRVFNFGNAPVSFTTLQIFASNNASVNPTANTCGTSLQNNQTCAYAAPIIGNVAYSCRIVDGSTSSSLSGAAEIQNSTGEVLNALPLTH